MPITKKSFAGFVQGLAKEEGNARRDFKEDKRMFADHDAKVDELIVKVRLLADISVKMTSTWPWLTAIEAALAPLRVVATITLKALHEMNGSRRVLCLEWNLLQAAGQRREKVMQSLIQRVCTGYSGLMHTHVRSHRNRLRAFFAVLQLSRKYLGRGGGSCLRRWGRIIAHNWWSDHRWETG